MFKGSVKYQLISVNVLLRVILISMVSVLKMPAKLASLGVLKIKVLGKKLSEVIFPAHESFLMPIKLYSTCSHVTKLGNSSICMRPSVL